MQTPRRTIQDVEVLGDHEIRGIYAVCIELLIQRDRWVMQAIKEKIERSGSGRRGRGVVMSLTVQELIDLLTEKIRIGEFAADAYVYVECSRSGSFVYGADRISENYVTLNTPGLDSCQFDED